MSQSKFNKITIRNKLGAEDQTSKGANMEILLDGKKLDGAYFAKFEVHARKVAKVTIEMYAEVEIEANVETETNRRESDELVHLDGRPMGIHAISNYSPVAIVRKKT
jgi:hypothetical protein